LSFIAMWQPKHIIRSLVGAYLILSLPVMFVFSYSEYVRYVAVQMVTNWRGKLIGLPAAYVGDSITAGGRNWGAPFEAINLAGSGYTVSQIRNQLPKAATYSPRRIFILAGTNDILGSDSFDPILFRQQYAHLLDSAADLDADVFITTIPFTSNQSHSRLIAEANSHIRDLAQHHGFNVVELNPIIAPEGLLLAEYTGDGVHLNSRAHSVWRKLLAEAVSRHQQ
jgi:lysophospholipase L1-like esterase